MPGTAPPITIAQYLQTRLEQLGLDRLFTVPGNYTAPLLNTLLADPRRPIAITGVANELCAGYAADAYARNIGIGAVAVTYGVGAYSLLNAIAGSFVERIPVVVINGGPTHKEVQKLETSRLLYSHLSPDPSSNAACFRQVTIAAQRIVSASEAPAQIDATLTACA